MFKYINKIGGDHLNKLLGAGNNSEKGPSWLVVGDTRYTSERELLQPSLFPVGFVVSDNKTKFMVNFS